MKGIMPCTCATVHHHQQSNKPVVQCTCARRHKHPTRLFRVQARTRRQASTHTGRYTYDPQCAFQTHALMLRGTLCRAQIMSVHVVCPSHCNTYIYLCQATPITVIPRKCCQFQDKDHLWAGEIDTPAQIVRDHAVDLTAVPKRGDAPPASHTLSHIQGMIETHRRKGALTRQRCGCRPALGQPFQHASGVPRHR